MAASDSKLNVNSEAEKVIIHEIPLSEHAKSLEDSNSQMIQIVVYLQSLLRQVLFVTHWISGSNHPNIPRFYIKCTCINTDANLLVCLPESWSH
jgi:hypothetical protein